MPSGEPQAHSLIALNQQNHHKIRLEQDQRYANLDPEEALRYWLDQPGIDPLDKYLGSDNILELYPLLEKLHKSLQKDRQAVDSVIQYYLTDSENLTKSQRALCHDLGFNYSDWIAMCRRNSAIMKFVNYVLVSHAKQVRGLVHLATARAGIVGTHHDRRLYLELIGDIRRGAEGHGHGPINIVFVNDTLSRPGSEPSILEAEAEDAE